jgi:hypothetical protein
MQIADYEDLTDYTDLFIFFTQTVATGYCSEAI